jgi:hypothetical protein
MTIAGTICDLATIGCGGASKSTSLVPWINGLTTTSSVTVNDARLQVVVALFFHGRIAEAAAGDTREVTDPATATPGDFSASRRSSAASAVKVQSQYRTAT